MDQCIRVLTRFLGTSGQNIDDMQLYSAENSRMKLAIQTLRCAHIAPTAPDTLLCQPFKENDPMVLEDLPDVYYIGNQPEFQYEKIEIAGKTVLVILVPDFQKTGTIVIVDGKKLECWPVTFDVNI